jgi:hypothetical protein
MSTKRVSANTSSTTWKSSILTSHVVAAVNTVSVECRRNSVLRLTMPTLLAKVIARSLDLEHREAMS